MSELSDPNSQPGHQPFAADDAQPLTPTHRGNVGKGDGRQHRLRTAALEAEVLTGVHETSEQQARRSLLRRLARITAGSLLLLAGILMLVLPGPGWIAIAGGLAVLSRDVAWAARLLEIVRDKVPGVPADGQIPRSTWISIILVTTSAGILGALFFHLISG
ncbi:MAG: PGPGW domain-containing protein [Acidimicrobiia bacterium]|jgi:uncharacterized protein (TIGR02611 family)|nr:PGPGW domain-containing protein [Acidimicrobiia bacterium]